jgi:hypothetical protein
MKPYTLLLFKFRFRFRFFFFKKKKKKLIAFFILKCHVRRREVRFKLGFSCAFNIFHYTYIRGLLGVLPVVFS